MSGEKSTPSKSSVPTGTDGAETAHGKPEPEPTTAARWERGKLLLKDTGKKCPIELNGRDVATWAEITDWLSDEEGYPIKRQSVQKAFEATMRRLGELLLQDPYIRDWYIENVGELPKSEGDSWTP